MSKLITRDHVVALIGENASSRSLAAAPIAQSYRVPMVSPTSTNVEVTKKGDYIFRVCFIDSYQGRVLSTFARRNLKASTAAILTDARSDYSVGLADSLPGGFTAAGGRIVAEAKYAEGDSDFSAQLTAIRARPAGRPLRPGLLHRRRPHRAAGASARARRDASRRGRLGFPQAHRDRRGSDRGRLLLQPLLGGRSVARRSQVRGRLPGQAYGAGPRFDRRARPTTRRA